MDKIKQLLNSNKIYMIIFVLFIVLIVLILGITIISHLKNIAGLTKSGNNINYINNSGTKNPNSLPINNDNGFNISSSNNQTISTSSSAQTNGKKPVIDYKPSTTSSTSQLTSTPTNNSNGSAKNPDSVSSSSTGNLSILTDLFKVLLTVPSFTGITTTNQAVITPIPLQTIQTKINKLGVFILSNYNDNAKKIIAAKPRIIKIMDPQTGNLLQAAKDFKNTNPAGISVVRFYQGSQNIKYSLIDDPTSSAQDFFNQVISPGINSLGANRSYFDYIEAPNELDNTLGWESDESAGWLSQFWSTLVNLNYQSGYKTCIGSIPVGNPPGSYQDIQNRLQQFLPTLIKARQTNGALCYHSYTLNYSTDLNEENFTSLRYRMIHDIISQLNPDLSNLPFILSEAGVDQNGNPAASGWQARGDVNKYANWLSWYDNQISQDNYVLGATLFQIGDSSWSSFNLDPMTDWLTNSIK